MPLNELFGTFCRGALVAGAVVSLMLTPAVAAPDFLTIVAPSGPGSGTDQTARALQDAMQANGIVRAVQVENLPGGGGVIATSHLAQKRGNAEILMVGGLAVMSAMLTSQAPVSINDLTPIARLTTEWQAIVVPVESSINTVQDLTKLMTADPGSVSWAGGAAGGLDQVAVGLFADAIGVDPARINYVPHAGGGEAAIAVMGKHVTVGVSGLGEFEQIIKGGQLRLLAVMSPDRIEGLDAPTLKESGIDLEVGNWRAVFAPADITAADDEALAETIRKATETKTWNNNLATKGWTGAFLSGKEFKDFSAAEATRFTAVLRSLGLIR